MLFGGVGGGVTVACASLLAVLGSLLRFFGMRGKQQITERIFDVAVGGTEGQPGFDDTRTAALRTFVFTIRIGKAAGQVARPSHSSLEPHAK